jgi:hypothetical protein
MIDELLKGLVSLYCHYIWYCSNVCSKKLCQVDWCLLLFPLTYCAASSAVNFHVSFMTTNKGMIKIKKDYN